MTTYRLFPSTNGPSANTYSGSFLSGVTFEITGGKVCWFEGYWYWLGSGASTSPVKCALWLRDTWSDGYLIPGSVVTSSTLTSGQWNYIPLATPIPLSVGGPTATLEGSALYIAAIGVNGPFSESNSTGSDVAHSFGAAGYNNGIVTGPLTAFSDEGGNLPASQLVQGSPPQGCFAVASDPAVTMPSAGDNSGNFWVDVQVSDTLPAGYSGSYRLWPNLPSTGGSNVNGGGDTGAQTLGTCFSLSRTCMVNKVWFYSPPGSGALPASTQIWNCGTQALMSGANLSASWSGSAGSGWIYNDYSSASITLPAGNYIATIYYGGGNTFYGETRGYFGTFQGVTGPGSGGLANGPLSSPATANAPNPPGGNSCYFTGGTSPTYPELWDHNDGGENRWVDVEVTPAASAPTPVNSGAFLIFFP